MVRNKEIPQLSCVIIRGGLFMAIIYYFAKWKSHTNLTHPVKVF